jgi:FkbM family methyltransferase
MRVLKNMFSIDFKDRIKNKIKKYRNRSIDEKYVNLIAKFYLHKSDFNGHTMYYRFGSNDKSVIDDVLTNNEYLNYDLKINENSTMLDIGGHIGSFTIQAAKIAKNGIIYTFEPFINNFKLIKKNIEANNLNNVELYNAGVLDEDKTVDFFISNVNTGMHSTIPLKKFNSRILKVNCLSLDKFIKDNKIKTIDLIKLDCEGAEYSILYNSDLSIVNQIILEFHEFPDSNDNIDTLTKKLNEKRFKLVKKVRYPSDDVGFGVAYYSKL